MATMIGTLATLACWIASTVCGMTPSSAATTSTTRSVTCAPRARIAVNASWPGVSMNTTGCPSAVSILYAPMRCVMPPASPDATRVLRMESRIDVLPWSTWPMTVTMGGRVTSLPGSSLASEKSSSREVVTTAPSPWADSTATTSSLLTGSTV